MIDVEQISRHVDSLRDAVRCPTSVGRTDDEWAHVLEGFVDQLDVSVEEMRQQNEDLLNACDVDVVGALHYQEMFECAPDGYIVTDEYGVIQEVNESASSMLRVRQEHLQRKPLSVYIDTADRRTFRQVLKNALTADVRQIIELKVQPRDRIPVIVEFSVRSNYRVGGGPEMLLWILRDLSVRDQRVHDSKSALSSLETQFANRTEMLIKTFEPPPRASQPETTEHWLSASVRRQLDFLTEIGETLSESDDAGRPLSLLLSCVVPARAEWGVIALLDDDGSLVESLAAHENPEFDRIMKADMGVESFQPGSMLICAADVLKTAMPHSLAKGDPRSDVWSPPAGLSGMMSGNSSDYSILSVPLRSRGQTIGVLELGRGRSWAPFDSDDLSYVLGLTSRSSSALDAARLAERVKLADAARDRFLAVAAHELRTPITIVRGYAQILARLLADSREIETARALRMSRAIQDQADRLAAIVEQMVDVTRLNLSSAELHVERTDISSMVADQLANVQATTANHLIEVDIEPQVVALVDRLRFVQVVNHLVDNAIKFSLNGGAIHVSLAREADGLLIFSVTDWGMGIEPAYRQGIFERFYVGHDRTDIRGLGLGLFISREFMRLHGGDLRVEYPKDASTRFVAELPTESLIAD